MGILDDVSSAADRAKGAATRKAEELQINNRLADLVRRRRELTAQLGASLFDVIREDPVLREGREDLVLGIEAIDIQRAECQERLAELQAEAIDAQRSATVYRCANCGAPIRATDQYCGACGAPASVAIPRPVTPGAPVPPGPTVTVGGPVCPACGAPIQPGDAFCMACGAKIPEASVTVEGDGSAETVEVRTPEETVEVVEPGTCPQCGAPVEPGTRFCMRCGSPLD